jgi:hypothetical protein
VIDRRVENLSMAAETSKTPDSWSQLSRGLEYDGEERANQIRLIAVGLFYAVHLVRYVTLPFDDMTEDRIAVWNLFHIQVTLLAVFWTMLGLGLKVALQYRLFPSWLKYLSTGVDLTLMSSILLIADGPRSPATVGYFVIVAVAALRFRLRIIWCATGGAMLLYLALNIHALYFSSREIDIPPQQTAMFLVALALEGVTIGQLVRKTEFISRMYSLRESLAEPGGEE